MSKHRKRAALALAAAPRGTEVRLQYLKGTAQVVVKCGDSECVTSIPDGRDLEEGVCFSLNIMAERGYK